MWNYPFKVEAYQIIQLHKIGSHLQKGSGSMHTVWAVFLKGCNMPRYILVSCVYAVNIRKSEVLKMPKGQWNVIVYYAHSSVCAAIGRRHRARFMPKGEWFCAVLCILGIDRRHQAGGAMAV